MVLAYVDRLVPITVQIEHHDHKKQVKESSYNEGQDRYGLLELGLLGNAVVYIPDGKCTRGEQRDNDKKKSVYLRHQWTSNSMPWYHLDARNAI